MYRRDRENDSTVRASVRPGLRRLLPLGVRCSRCPLGDERPAHARLTFSQDPGCTPGRSGI